MVRIIILNLDSFKATPVVNIDEDDDDDDDDDDDGDDIHLPFIIKIINLSFENNCFPNGLKLPEVSPVF